MAFEGTYELASEIIDKTEEKFRSCMVLNDSRYLGLEAICAEIDKMVTDFGGESVEVTADEMTGDMRIKVICFEIVIRDSDHYFYDLLKMVNGVHFTKTGEDSLAVEFILSDMWVRVDE